MRELSPEPWRVKIVERIRSISPESRVAEVVKRLHRELEKLRGVRIVRQAPVLRHFTAQFELV
jgi:tryptophanase